MLSPPTGRRPLSCSPACKVRRDRTLRKVQRRRAWQALWREAGGRGYSSDQVQREIDILEQEIDALLTELHP